MAKGDILNIIRGDTHTINVNLKQDLTGATVFFTVNPESNPETDADKVIQKIITDFDDAVAGTLSFQLLPEDTNELEPESYWYDFQIVRSSSLVQSTRKARFQIVSDITRGIIS